MIYRVLWEIDVEAKDEVEAAKLAWKMVRSKASTANVFTVKSKKHKSSVIVDLEEIEQKEIKNARMQEI